MAEGTSDVGSKVVNVFFYHSDTMSIFLNTMKYKNETGELTAAWPLFGM